MAIYWGVVSSHAANSAVAVAGNPTLLDYITQQVQLPQFWGRYIGEKHALTSDEKDFIFHNSNGSCRILLIYNGATPGNDNQGGAADATTAIEAAQALGVPPGVTLYADIESGVEVNPDWIRGWWQTMHNSMYANAGGFYCNPAHWNAQNFSNPYCIAINDPSNLTPDGTFIFNPPLFSSSPRKDCTFMTTDPSQFTPDEPPCVPGSAVIWQYALGCFQDAYPPHGLCDMDLANVNGYTTMWSGSLS